MVISSKIDSTAKTAPPECIKHDLELVFGKKCFFVFQCCNFLKTVQNVNFISNKQHSKKLDIQSASNMISSLFMEKNVFLYFIKHDLELVYGKKVVLYFNVATC